MVACSTGDGSDAQPPLDLGEDLGALDLSRGDGGPLDAGGDLDAGDLGAVDLSIPDLGAPDLSVPPGTPLRVVAANLTSGNNQNYDAGHGFRILQGLQPDIVLIQEFNYLNDADAEIRMALDEALGPGFSFHRGATGSIPNGVISRWPILESGTWADAEVGNRGFDWARIDIPGPVDLWVVSVHFLTRNATVRGREATELIGYIQANVPPSDYLVLGGDLNTQNRNEGAIVTLRAEFSTLHTPVDRNNNDNTNAGRTRPYDWVLPDADLEAHHTPVQIGAQQFSDGLVFDSRVFVPLSEVPPVMLGDSDAPQMQHMAVIRDFAIP